jgi:NADH-quinone oxidoreductase E subunit
MAQMALELSPDTRKACEEVISHYPSDWKQAAILPVLHLAQKEWGYIPLEGLKQIAEMLDMPPARAAGVMSFYPMFHKAPVGKHVIQVCSTLSCALCGARQLLSHLKQKLKVDVGETTEDGRFTIEKSECLAACEGGPAVRVNDTLYRNATVERMERILEELD